MTTDDNGKLGRAHSRDFGGGLVMKAGWRFKSIEAANWDEWVARYAAEGELFPCFSMVAQGELPEAMRFAEQLYGRGNVLTGDPFDSTQGRPVQSATHVGVYILPAGLAHAAKRWLPLQRPSDSAGERP